jgi:hypothetical protein
VGLARRVGIRCAIGLSSLRLALVAPVMAIPAVVVVGMKTQCLVCRAMALGGVLLLLLQFPVLLGPLLRKSILWFLSFSSFFVG